VQRDRPATSDCRRRAASTGEKGAAASRLARAWESAAGARDVSASGAAPRFLRPVAAGPERRPAAPERARHSRLSTLRHLQAIPGAPDTREGQAQSGLRLPGRHAVRLRAGRRRAVTLPTGARRGLQDRLESEYRWGGLGLHSLKLGSQC
jgi:hypothetical protein